jgi:hypothetical protein
VIRQWVRLSDEYRESDKFCKETQPYKRTVRPACKFRSSLGTP